MRIIGRIPHPLMQISVFATDGRFPVQFELGGQAQIYRFRQSEQLRGLDDLRSLLDDDFLREVLVQFTAMQRMQARLLPGAEADAAADFPEII
ncbi:hypothetical protein QWY85_18475 [Neolewinella lacunae]|uniref:Uncharacterized protein n=1 Tax=Neolewinella lacunae TaxID=1517758 RepID=A0A923TF12_9BACT|nr:hypothetical protein [Neolewinella lacunae]MBC6996507.1 hypothetical protein [Neolewinella lacunae]MDN3636660.1 hypothetical protein [Neolewinella lacunae]